VLSGFFDISDLIVFLACKKSRYLSLSWMWHEMYSALAFKVERERDGKDKVEVSVVTSIKQQNNKTGELL